MQFRHHLIALAATALLAACGGGNDNAVTPESAASAMRAHALSAKPSSAATAAVAAAATTITPEESARQLMDFGESVFKAYFPEHQTTQTFGPFKYRAYSSGILLGVVVTADPAYTLGGVYVMGGVFGNSPVYVGQLTSFITPVAPVDPDPGPTGSGNGCHDLGLSETEGTHSTIAYQYVGPVTGNITTDLLIGGLATFEGQQAREATAKANGTTATAGVTVPIDTLVKTYQRRTGDAEMTIYGSKFSNTSTVAGFTTTTDTKTVNTPAWVDRSYALAIGQSLTTTQNSTITATTTITGSPVALPPTTTTSNSSTTQTVKYVGRESVSVPAGTYSACKYETTNGGAVTTQWVIVGKGLMVKSVSVTGNITQTLQATSVKLNGQSL